MIKSPNSLIVPLKKVPVSDVRDWDAIRVWAEKISTEKNLENR
jgi:hypothetical protein